MKLSTKLRQHMARLGLSQDGLAERLGVSQSLVSKWLRGRGTPKAAEIRMMAELLGVSCDYLMDDERAVMEAEEAEYDREVRRIVRKVGARRVWEILMARLEAGPGGVGSGPPPLKTRTEGEPRGRRSGSDLPGGEDKRGAG